MRSLLLVDDEVFTIQGILDALPWEALGIGPVYTAYSMQQAQAVFDGHAIDILVSDIEMPQGSGMDLLEWVNVHSPETLSLLLTCHAEFEYAKQAVRLGCVDYLLKPVPFEKLEQLLVGVVEKANLMQRKNEYTRMGQMWQKNALMVESRFWTDLLNGLLPKRFHALSEVAAKQNVILDERDLYFPICISRKEMNAALEDWDTETLTYAIRNVITELMLPESGGIPVVMLSPACYVVLYRFVDVIQAEAGKQQKEMPTVHAISQDCLHFMQTCRRYLDIRFACYLGEWVDIGTLHPVLHQLLEQDRQNVAYFDAVHHLSNPERGSRIPPRTLDVSAWKGLLLAGKSRQVYTEAVQYLDDLTASRDMNATVLRTFFQNFIQTIHVVLSSKGIQAHQLLSSEDVIVTERHLATVDNAKAAIRRILSSVDTHLDMAEHAHSLVAQTREYIQAHLQDELTCEDVGAHFYLHPDHLTRLLKKETGMSLSELMVQERISAAQELLRRSSESVGDVALQVGYTNVSHFTRMFKRITGENPLAWRKQAAERPPLH